jgi:hypothetical protein
MFQKAVKDHEGWQVVNTLGHALRLPSDASFADRAVSIAVMGTQRRKPLPSGVKVTELLAAMLASLGRALYVIDTRRDGVGGQSSWSPREFAAVIPALIGGRAPYAYLHLPCLAPSVELLGNKALTWQQYRSAYQAELSTDDVDVARAFIETSASAGGLAVFFCAEADHPDFDQLAVAEQEKLYCHRFTLAKHVANRLKAAHDNVTVNLVHLDLVDYYEQTRVKKAYSPRVTPL